MKKQYKPSIDKTTALDFAIRDYQNEFEYGYTIEGKMPYNNYLSNEAWKSFLDSMSDSHKKQYKDADGGELDSKKGKWGMMPPKMASFGSSSRLIYECSKSISGFCFEKQLPTQLGPRPANLDGYLCRQDEDIFVEAKCREIYSSHINQKVSVVYKDVYEHIKEKNPNYFGYKAYDIEKYPNHISCSFILNQRFIYHFDVKQLICHFLGISANILQNKANTNIRFIYLIFNPNFDTDFSNEYIERFKTKILDEYQETVDEIRSFGDFKWLFDAVMDYQSNNLKLLKPDYRFEFDFLDQKTYGKKLYK